MTCKTARAALLLVGVWLARSGAGAELPPAPARWVTDGAGFLSDAARQRLDVRLEGFQQQSGHHVLVWIGRTTGGIPIEDLTVRAFAAWKVGRRGLDDGVVLFVFAEDRKVRIEVGYGLEAQVPDAIASRIIGETIVPRIQVGDRDGALESGAEALLAAIEGRPLAGPPATLTEPAPPAPVSRAAPGLSVGEKIIVGIVVIAFLILLVTNPILALNLLFSILSSGGRGGSGGGGSGYSGGGGRSGGGGATGSW